MPDPPNPRDPIDEASDESFPASDPPESTGMHAGAPSVSALAAPAAVEGATTDDLVTVRSPLRFHEAVARVEEAVTGAGMKLFARIDQAAEAQSVGLDLRPATVILFGSPKAGTPLMAARPTTAIDLPLKALVWQDGRGVTWLTYNKPDLLVRRHGLEEALAKRLSPVGDLLRKAVGAEGRVLTGVSAGR